MRDFNQLRQVRVEPYPVYVLSSFLCVFLMSSVANADAAAVTESLYLELGCLQAIAAYVAPVPSVVSPPAPPVPLPPVGDTKAWKAFCFGDEARSASAGLSAETRDGLTSRDSHNSGQPPLLSVLVALDHVSTLKLLTRHIQRLCCMHCVPPSMHMAWMYGLLARTDLPLCPDTASTLRMLLKHFCKLRAELCSKARPSFEVSPAETADTRDDAAVAEPDADSLGSDAEEPQVKRYKVVDEPSDAHALARLNVVITLVHRVFGQMEQ